MVKMRRPISRLNLVGIALVAMGAVRYAVVSARERKLREKHGATSAGSGKKADDALAPNGDRSAGPLLPTAATAAAAVVLPSGTMVNGKGPLKKGKGKAEREGRAGKKTRGLAAWGRWWGDRNGDDSHRNS